MPPRLDKSLLLACLISSVILSNRRAIGQQEPDEADEAPDSATRLPSTQVPLEAADLDEYVIPSSKPTQNESLVLEPTMGHLEHQQLQQQQQQQLQQYLQQQDDTTSAYNQLIGQRQQQQQQPSLAVNIGHQMMIPNRPANSRLVLSNLNNNNIIDNEAQIGAFYALDNRANKVPTLSLGPAIPHSSEQLNQEIGTIQYPLTTATTATTNTGQQLSNLVAPTTWPQHRQISQLTTDQLRGQLLHSLRPEAIVSRRPAQVMPNVAPTKYGPTISSLKPTSLQPAQQLMVLSGQVSSSSSNTGSQLQQQQQQYHPAAEQRKLIGNYHGRHRAQLAPVNLSALIQPGETILEQKSTTSRGGRPAKNLKLVDVNEIEALLSKLKSLSVEQGSRKTVRGPPMGGSSYARVLPKPDQEDQQEEQEEVDENNDSDSDSDSDGAHQDTTSDTRTFIESLAMLGQQGRAPRFKHASREPKEVDGVHGHSLGGLHYHDDDDDSNGGQNPAPASASSNEADFLNSLTAMSRQLRATVPPDDPIGGFYTARPPASQRELDDQQSTGRGTIPIEWLVDQLMSGSRRASFGAQHSTDNILGEQQDGPQLPGLDPSQLDSEDEEDEVAAATGDDQVDGEADDNGNEGEEEDDDDDEEDDSYSSVGGGSPYPNLEASESNLNAATTTIVELGDADISANESHPITGGATEESRFSSKLMPVNGTRDEWVPLGKDQQVVVAVRPQLNESLSMDGRLDSKMAESRGPKTIRLKKKKKKRKKRRKRKLKSTAKLLADNGGGGGGSKFSSLKPAKRRAELSRVELIRLIGIVNEMASRKEPSKEREASRRLLRSLVRKALLQNSSKRRKDPGERGLHHRANHTRDSIVNLLEVPNNANNTSATRLHGQRNHKLPPWRVKTMIDNEKREDQFGDNRYGSRGQAPQEAKVDDGAQEGRPHERKSLSEVSDDLEKYFDSDFFEDLADKVTNKSDSDTSSTTADPSGQRGAKLVKASQLRPQSLPLPVYGQQQLDEADEDDVDLDHVRVKGAPGSANKKMRRRRNRADSKSSAGRRPKRRGRRRRRRPRRRQKSTKIAALGQPDDDGDDQSHVDEGGPSKEPADGRATEVAGENVDEQEEEDEVDGATRGEASRQRKEAESKRVSRRKRRRGRRPTNEKTKKDKGGKDQEQDDDYEDEEEDEKEAQQVDRSHRRKSTKRKQEINDKTLTPSPGQDSSSSLELQNDQKLKQRAANRRRRSRRRFKSNIMQVDDTGAKRELDRDEIPAPIVAEKPKITIQGSKTSKGPAPVTLKKFDQDKNKKLASQNKENAASKPKVKSKATSHQSSVNKKARPPVQKTTKFEGVQTTATNKTQEDTPTKSKQIAAATQPVKRAMDLTKATPMKRVATSKKAKLNPDEQPARVEGVSSGDADYYNEGTSYLGSCDDNGKCKVTLESSSPSLGRAIQKSQEDHPAIVKHLDKWIRDEPY